MGFYDGLILVEAVINLTQSTCSVIEKPSSFGE